MDCNGIKLHGSGRISAEIQADAIGNGNRTHLIYFRPSDRENGPSPKRNSVEGLRLRIRPEAAGEATGIYGIKHDSARYPAEKSEDVSIMGNDFSGSSGILVMISNCNNAKVKGNIFQDIGDRAVSIAVRMVGSYDGGEIQGNKIKSANNSYITNAIYIGTQDVNGNASQKVGSSRNINISGNTVSLGSYARFAQGAVKIAASVGVTVTGNTFENTDAAGNNYGFIIQRDPLEITNGEDISDIIVSGNTIKGFNNYIYPVADLVNVERLAIFGNEDFSSTPLSNNFLLNYPNVYYSGKEYIKGVAPAGAQVDIPLPYGGSGAAYEVVLSGLHSETTGSATVALKTGSGREISTIDEWTQMFAYSSDTPTIRRFTGASSFEVLVGSGLVSAGTVRLFIESRTGRTNAELFSAAFNGARRGSLGWSSGDVVTTISLSKNGEEIGEVPYTIRVIR